MKPADHNKICNVASDVSPHGYFPRARVLLLVLLCVVSAVALDNDCPPAERGWWVRICEAKTEAAGVSIDLGLGGAGVRNTHRFWRQWHHGDPTEFSLPFDRQDLWHARKIWIQGTTLTHGRNVYMGLGFNDHIVKHMDFDNVEYQERVRTETDEWKCP